MVFVRILLLLLISELGFSEASASNTNHPCRRPCNGVRMLCEYHFRLEMFYSLDIRACFNCPKNVTDCFRKDCIPGGGIKKNVHTLNRSLPAPSIEVCQGDIVMVTVENLLRNDETVTIHWHGQHMVRTPYMDGVPWITQCPVMSETNFTYTFEAAQHGTHFYHSHDRAQRGDGVFGSLIVRQPRNEDAHRGLYDEDLYEHQVIVTDWDTRPKHDVLGDFFHNGIFARADGLLVNGLGPLNMNNTEIPFAKFLVKKGKRYRFRFIGAAFYACPIAVSIDNHGLKVLSSDGFNLEPTDVSAFILHNGERYDFVLNADQEIGTYWIRFKGLDSCAPRTCYQLALLQYEGSTQEMPSVPKPTYQDAVIEGSRMLNDLDDNEGIKVSTLKSWEPIDPELQDPNVKPIYVEMNFARVANPLFYHSPYYDPKNLPANLIQPTPALNNIIFDDPATPLLPNKQYYENGRHFCSADTLTRVNCSSEFCHCTHVVELPLDEVVELIVFGGTKINVHHPMHLHGAAFNLVAWENVADTITKEEIQDLDRRGLIRRNFNYPPQKDTMAVVTGGYAVLRFKAVNPGYWLFHCHVDPHSELGMRMVLKVGDSRDMKSAPHGFPTCGSFPK